MSILFQDVGFEWPTGQTVFNHLNLSLHEKTYGLVGSNGAGKTTLARLITGELTPTDGVLKRTTEIRIFQQIEPPPVGVSVKDFLYLNERGLSSFVSTFLEKIDKDQLCENLSGGEWTRVRLSQLILSEVRFIILDEPTNHLDQSGQQAVQEFVRHFDGGLLIISHDRELLELVEDIIELSSQGVSLFGGSWSEYNIFRRAEKERLQQALESATRERDRTYVERHEKLEKQEKRNRHGKKDAAKGGTPKIILGMRKRAAQKTSGQIDATTIQDVEQAASEAWQAYESLKVDPIMYARLPQIKPIQGKTVMEATNFNFRYEGMKHNLWKSDLNFSFRGPARIAIRGRNGSGKSTLLQLLKDEKLKGESFGALRRGTLRYEYLSQDHSSLNSEESILENIQSRALLSEPDLRSLLAMFLFKGQKVYEKVNVLSGGERLRAALAQVLMAQPPAELLILDEPTNNLDLFNIEFLEELLKQYQGALIVVSHDSKFLNNLSLTDEVILE